jgi:hypothetical protein
MACKKGKCRGERVKTCGEVEIPMAREGVRTYGVKGGDSIAREGGGAVWLTLVLVLEALDEVLPLRSRLAGTLLGHRLPHPHIYTQQDHCFSIVVSCP